MPTFSNKKKEKIDYDAKKDVMATHCILKNSHSEKQLGCSACSFW